MAYFNHAYRQTYVVSSGDLIEGEGTASSALQAGKLAILDAATYASVAKPATSATHLGSSSTAGTTSNGLLTTGYLIGQGNHNLTGTNSAASPGAGDDVIGNGSTSTTPAAYPPAVNFHGGYAESYKSKIIVPKYLTALYKDGNVCGTVDTGVIEIQVPDTCFECNGSTSLRNQLRLDFKGNAVLRYLNRFAYSTYYIKDCCANMDPGNFLTGAAVAAEFANQINADPIVNPFVTASVTAGTSGNNILRLTLGYTATFFDNCSFDTRDNVDTEPLIMKATVLDEDGDVCVDTCLTGAASSGGAQAAMPAEGITVDLLKRETTGENVLRDLILDRRYSQDGGHNQGNRDSARFREIEKGTNILGAVDRTAFYKRYMIQHTVPRFNNPTGVFDNDQYIYNIYFDCADSAGQTAFELFLDGFNNEALASGRNIGITTL
tara:strand:- start:58831 stop:60135 length:1305 start_codon:yes stop_codon:yes gene_type:complete